MMRVAAIFLALAACALAGFGRGCDKGGFTNCLKACRSCGELPHLGEFPADNLEPFIIKSKVCGDCKQAWCRDPTAAMVVDNKLVKRVVCYQKQWSVEEPGCAPKPIEGAACHPRPNNTCDEDASQFFNTETNKWECECNKGFIDQSEDFGLPRGSICTQCKSKALNIVLLLDQSGSLFPATEFVSSVSSNFIRFFNISKEATLFAYMEFSASFSLKYTFNETVSSSDLAVSLGEYKAEGKPSDLGFGLEGVKARIVQPYHPNWQNPHVLVTITDGAVVIGDRQDSIQIALSKLDRLGVTPFAVGTNQNYNYTLPIIAGGYESNVVYSDFRESDPVLVANKLQKLVCA